MTWVTAYTEARAQARTQAWEQLAQKNFRDYTLRRFRADYLARLRETRQTRAKLERVS